MAAPKKRIRIKKPPILFARSQKLIARLERASGAALLTYWMSPSGSVCDSDVVALYEHCRRLRGKSIGLFIKSQGDPGRPPCGSSTCSDSTRRAWTPWSR